MGVAPEEKVFEDAKIQEQKLKQDVSLSWSWGAVEVYALSNRDSVKGFHACGVPALGRWGRRKETHQGGPSEDFRLWQQRPPVYKGLLFPNLQ